LAWGCPTVDSGGEGAGRGAFHPSMVVALAGLPQLLSCSVLVLACSPLVKVQPSLASPVVMVDIFLVWRRWFLWVFLVELLDDVVRVFEVVGRIPGAIGVVEAGPLDSILDLIRWRRESQTFFTSHSCCSWMTTGGSGSWLCPGIGSMLAVGSRRLIWKTG